MPRLTSIAAWSLDVLLPGLSELAGAGRRRPEGATDGYAAGRLRVASPERLTLRTAAGLVDVLVGTATERERAPTALSLLERGDRVEAIGEWRDGELLALRLLINVVRIQGVVEALDADALTLLDREGRRLRVPYDAHLRDHPAGGLERLTLGAPVAVLAAGRGRQFAALEIWS